MHFERGTLKQYILRGRGGTFEPVATERASCRSVFHCSSPQPEEEGRAGESELWATNNFVHDFLKVVMLTISTLKNGNSKATFQQRLGKGENE
jgi:hypothetical protein